MELDEPTLRTLTECADRAAIEKVLGLYCRAIDRLDVELLRSIYHADATDDHGAMHLPAHEFAPRIVEMLSRVCTYSMHTVTHAVVDLHGKQATSEAYYLGFHTIDGNETAVGEFFGAAYLEAQRAAGLARRPHEYVCGGRYLDLFEKRDGEWRILRRKITNEFSVCRPQSAVQEGMPASFYTPGTRDRNDPVYGLMTR